MKNDTLRMEQRQDGVTAGGQAMRRYSCEDLNRGKNPVMQSWWRNVPGTGRGKSHGSDGEVGSVRGSSSTKLQSDSSAQLSRSVTQSCPTLCDPMDYSTPGLPVHHQPPELTQTHVH